MGDTGVNLGDSGNLTGRGPQSSEDKTANTFIGITLRGWAISAISAVAVLTAVGGGFITLWDKYQSSKTQVRVTTTAVGTLSAINTRLTDELQPVEADTAAKVADAAKHLKDKDHFETFPIDSDPEVTARYYSSDGCIHIIRKHPQIEVSKKRKSPKDEVLYGLNDQDFWVPDPSRIPGNQNSLKVQPRVPAINLHVNAVTIKKILPDLSANRLSVNQRAKPQLHRVSAPLNMRVGMFQGSCMNPHPGVFQFRNQQVNACEVQVWRTFVDGCTHYQMYNACTGQWGQGVVWTFCSIQHRW